MSPLRLLSSLALSLVLTLSCGAVVGGGDAVHRYNIHPRTSGRGLDAKMSDYLKKHLQNRTDASILSPDGIEVVVHVGDEIGGDFGVTHLPNGGYELNAKDERTMIWLVYMFIKEISKKDKGIVADDLPPSMFPKKDTVVTFPFEYRDLYMPTNQNPDMTLLLALHNLEMDWGIWGHNLSRVLGGSGDLSGGFRNMNQELLAKDANGVVHQTQFCFSSDRLLELTEKYILDQYGEGDTHPMPMTIGPNDNGFVCLCRRCVQAGNTKDNAMPAVSLFVERLAARFPKHTFFIPAYYTTAAKPTHHLPSNVGVFLSAIDYPRVWNGDDSPKAKEFFDLLSSWQKVTDKVYIWDYVCNFDDYLTPYPILYVMQDRFREYRARGVKGVFLNGSGYFYSMQQEMYSFLLANLLVNPDANIPRMIKEYYADAMPNVGGFYSSVMLSLEEHARRDGKELPLYGGIEEALSTYLFEKEFREFYSIYLQASRMEMTHRERVIYEKTRQFVSFTFLEMCRLHGISSGGFAERVGEEWVVKPEVWSALEDLKTYTAEDDLYILTDNEMTSPDHMDRVNESGVYVADYENEIELWLSAGYWIQDHLLGRGVTVHSINGTERNTRLTDAVAGISQNYHWGWQIYPQQNLVIEVPADAVSSRTGEFRMAFLNSERHRMSPPAGVEVWADGRQMGELHRQGMADYDDEGDRIVFRGSIAFPSVQQVELRFLPSRTRDLAIDEIYFR